MKPTSNSSSEPDVLILHLMFAQETKDVGWLMREFANTDLPVVDIDATIALLVSFFTEIIQGHLSLKDVVNWALDNCIEFRGYEGTEHRDYIERILLSYYENFYRELERLGLFNNGHFEYEFKRLLADGSVVLQRSSHYLRHPALPRLLAKAGG